MNLAIQSIKKIVKDMQDMPNKPWTKNQGDNETPYFIYGHRLEIANVLLQKDKDRRYKYQKYPLIALRMDFPERVYDGLYHYDLNIIIVDFTNKNYHVPDRYEHVFNPVLYPLYQEFIKRIKNSGVFMWPGDQSIAPHVKIDRPFWGIESREKNTEYVFNDPLDGIEILNLKINQIIKC